MTLDEAYEALDLNVGQDEWVKEQFRWYVKTFHPDNPETGCAAEFIKIMTAYRTIQNSA